MQNSLQNEWLKSYKDGYFKKYMDLPAPKWKRIDHEQLDWPSVSENSNIDAVISGAEDCPDILVSNMSNDLFKDGQEINYLQTDEYQGVGEKFVFMAQSLYNTGFFIKSSKNKKVEPVINISFKPTKDNRSILDHNIIVAQRSSELTVVFDYTSGEAESAFHNGITKVYAEENAIVNIFKIQRFKDDASNFDSNVLFAKNNAQIRITHIELGSAVSGVNYTSNLSGNGSEAEFKVIYLLDKHRKMDLGFKTIHVGTNTVSNLDVLGAMKDNSKKVFRGELNFKRGAKNSKGAESESVVIIGDNVKAHAIPALFCGEDDVEGQHAASIGKIDENKLFYLMSRGLSEEESRRTLIEASFMPIVDKLPHDFLKEIIKEELANRI